jgi:hypothetical protein
LLKAGKHPFEVSGNLHIILNKENGVISILKADDATRVKLGTKPSDQIAALSFDQHASEHIYYQIEQYR